MTRPPLDSYIQCSAMQLATLRDLGHALRPGATVLDFGCGDGELTGVYLRDGFDAFGCDIAFSPPAEQGDMFAKGVLRHIGSDPYRLPFDGDTFDLVVSNGVLEHVHDYDEAFREIRRVMKPAGASLHLFPSRYSPLEPHTRVPLASIVQSRAWLLFWARLGLRGPARQGLSARETARRNRSFLKDSTHYLPRREILRHVRPLFSIARFCEAEFIPHTPRGRTLARMNRVLPLVPFLYGALRNRVLFLVK